MLAAATAGGLGWFFSRYATRAETLVAVREMDAFEYPEDPADRSVHHSQYNGRRLRLVRKEGARFDFVFEPTADGVARITVRDVDASLFVPRPPAGLAGQPGLTRIALVDREWNRQQAYFDLPHDRVSVDGGDGFEDRRLVSVSMAKNCLNAGLWELLLFADAPGGKQLYYQGWFTFPLGHYKRVWEENTGLSYWDDLWWWRMEHWLDPAGTVVELGALRTVVNEASVDVTRDLDAPVVFAGEQARKRRTTVAPNVVTYGDVLERHASIRFGTFLPPGRYDNRRPWTNQYPRMAKLAGATLRKVRRGDSARELDEVELRFEAEGDGGVSRFFVGGIDLAALPTLDDADYPRGLYMPMGIGVPPFFQTYDELERSPAHESPYYCFWLDAEDRWIDHHSAAVDGPVLHRDAARPDVVKLRLLSYERHMIVGEFALEAPAGTGDGPREGAGPAPTGAL